MYSAIYIARQINQQAGGVLIAPWEVAQLPEMWLDAFALMQQELPEMQKNIRQFDNYVSAWRQKALAQKH